MSSQEIVRTKLFSAYEPRFSPNEHHTTLHTRYFSIFIHKLLPERLSSLDASRAMILLFCLNALDLLHQPLPSPTALPWILSRQQSSGGFDGGPLIEAHLAMTYSSLVALVTLRGDLSVVRPLKSLFTSLQLPDGSFRAALRSGEADARFVFSALASAWLVRDFDGIDTHTAAHFLAACFNAQDGGFGLRPGLESHGGATYCCVAGLRLLGALHEVLDAVQCRRIVDFCVTRQVAGSGGFNGRANKPPDTCYAFWIGATLQNLGYDRFIDRQGLASFLDTTFDPMMGGFGKTPGEMPDPLHSHFGICARVLTREDSSQHFDTCLGMSKRAFDTHVTKHPISKPYYQGYEMNLCC